MNSFTVEHTISVHIFKNSSNVWTGAHIEPLQDKAKKTKERKGSFIEMRIGMPFSCKSSFFL